MSTFLMRARGLLAAVSVVALIAPTFASAQVTGPRSGLPMAHSARSAASTVPAAPPLPDLSQYNLPPQIALREADKFGHPSVMSTEQAIIELTDYYRQHGSPNPLQSAIDDVRLTAEDDQESCSTLAQITAGDLAVDQEERELDAEQAKEPKKHRVWSVFRAILGAGEIGLAVFLDPKQLAYAGMVALTQVQSAGDRAEYERVMNLYNRRMMLYAKRDRLYSARGKLWDVKFGHWCNAMSGYDARYGYTPAPTVVFDPATRRNERVPY